MIFRNGGKLTKGPVAAGVKSLRMDASHTAVQLGLWLMVGVVGVGLGIYVSSLPALSLIGEIKTELDITTRTWSLLLILAAISPFVGIIMARLATSLRHLLLIAILLEIPVQIDYRFGYSELEQRYGTVSGFTVSITTICLVILYGWWLVEVMSKWRAMQHHQSRLSSVRLILPSMVYVVIVGLSILIARVPLAAFNWSGLVLQAFFLYVYIIHYIRTRQELIFIVTTLMVGLIFSGLVMIAFGVTGAGIDPAVAARSSSSVSRVGGRLADPNLAGSYLAMALVLVFSLFGIERGWRYKLLVTVSIGIGGIALLWTGSRGSWSSAALGVGLLGFFLLQQRWLPLKIPIFFLVLVGIIAAIFHEPLWDRLFSEQADQSASSRIPLMILSLRIIKDHFFLGGGANNFAYYLRDYVTAEMHGYWIRTVHNQYLLVWAENGLIGLGAYLWFLFTTLRMGWQAWQQKHDRVLAVITLGATASLFAAVFHMTGEKYHARVQVEMVFLMAGLVTAVYRLWATEQNATLLLAAHQNSQHQNGIRL